MVLKEVNRVTAKEQYLNVGQFKIPLRKDTECSTIDYIDLEHASRDNYQSEAVFPTGAILGHTIPAGSTLASRRPRSGAMGAVVPLATATRPFIATTTAYPISTSRTAAKPPSSSLASATLHTALTTRRRRYVHQEVCTIPLGKDRPQRPYFLRQQRGFSPSGAGQL